MEKGHDNHPREDEQLVASQDTEGEGVTRGKFLGSAAAAAAAAGGAGALFAGDAAASSAGSTAPLVYQYSKNKPDIAKVRIPGVKSFEELTISELVQLKPGTTEDTYEINAVSDNISVTTSSLLNELSHIRTNAATDSMIEAQAKATGNLEVLIDRA